MNRTLRTLYHEIINLNQWFRSGASWFFIPFTLLTSAGSIAILFIYLGIPQTLPYLLFAVFVLIFACLILGYALFKSRGEMIDKIMLQWRAPLTELAEVCFEWSILLYMDREGVPVPESLKAWGITAWSDLNAVYEYALRKGESAKAREICVQFFQERRK